MFLCSVREGRMMRELGTRRGLRDKKEGREGKWRRSWRGRARSWPLWSERLKGMSLAGAYPRGESLASLWCPRLRGKQETREWRRMCDTLKKFCYEKIKNKPNQTTNKRRIWKRIRVLGGFCFVLLCVVLRITWYCHT